MRTLLYFSDHSPLVTLRAANYHALVEDLAQEGEYFYHVPMNLSVGL